MIGRFTEVQVQQPAFFLRLLGQRRLEMARTMTAAIGSVAVDAGARDCSGALIPPAAAAAPNGNVGPQTDRALTAETGR